MGLSAASVALAHLSLPRGLTPWSPDGINRDAAPRLRLMRAVKKPRRDVTHPYASRHFRRSRPRHCRQAANGTAPLAWQAQPPRVSRMLDHLRVPPNATRKA